MSTVVPSSSHPGATSVEAPPQAAHAVPEDLRQLAIDGLKRKRKFWEDLTAFVAVNGVLWLIWALADRSADGWIPWPAWVTAIWGFLLVVDAWRAFAPWPRALHRPIGEEEVERELRRLERR